MSISVPVRVVQRPFGGTARRDTWWLQPLVVFLGLTTFLVYSGWAAFQGNHYTFGPYLSPFYSPEIFGDSPHSWFGPKPAAWPAWLPFSPALIILPIPGLFRLTCYYYRGAYYKAFWADPPSCTVGEPRSSYRGEHSFPLILQNGHRYALFLALAVLFVLMFDVWKALWFTDPATGTVSFGIGVGTLVLATNAVLLTLLSLRLPHAATSRGRRLRPALAQTARAPDLLLRELPEPPAHVVGVVQPVLGRLL